MSRMWQSKRVSKGSTCEPTNEYTKLLKQWRTRWNLRRIWTPKVGKMVEKKNPKRRRPWRRTPKGLCVVHDFDMPYRKYEWRLFLLNIKSYRGKRCKDKWFPAMVHWTTDIVEQKNKDQYVFPGDEISTHGTRNLRAYRTFSINQWPSATLKQPCLECDSQRESLIAGPIDVIEITKEDVHATLALNIGPLEVLVG
ncbi:hypothetical protein Cgig2_028163 [Carnegiea gigantea]|uniref:Uncharacterized protein n=1 Tax=Carnegiea gigantea TaxID=171969 RepID=A0A9Q1QA25_9CARY|nr:hypothetical protein Cgig2_028163 [Carnegiea gigantea]